MQVNKSFLSMLVTTRFAPSPTGNLHIGGARTALFNYLFARHNKGKFLLRIEDTDINRSSKEATELIFNNLKWLTIDWDDEVIFQSERRLRYLEVVEELISRDKAYYCFTTQEEINKLKFEALKNKKPFIFRSKWREQKNLHYISTLKPVVRLKVQQEGVTIIKDKLQGDVVINNSHIDDVILMRSNGSATYTLAVVVDDHDMCISHIIRGNDHLTNTAKQLVIYQALGWQSPTMVHIPLIHGPDGEKLSKRHGAIGVELYRQMGYLPEAICNYLLRLGWSNNNDEIISKDQAIKLFNIKGLGKSPSRVDFNKMLNLNGYYLRNSNNELLMNTIVEHLTKSFDLTEEVLCYIYQGINSLKNRALLTNDLSELAKVYLTNHPLFLSEEAEKIIKDCNKEVIYQVIKSLESIDNFTQQEIQRSFKDISKHNNIAFNELMTLVRSLVTGRVSYPNVCEVISIIGKHHSVSRIISALN